MAKGKVKFLYTWGLQNTASKFKSGIKEFDNCVTEMHTITNELFSSWEGEGKNQFETQYSLMKKKLDDISDTLYDIYDALVDSEKTYIDADEEAAKQISASMAN
jgi:WXG100 family type VII secretion target